MVSLEENSLHTVKSFLEKGMSHLDSLTGAQIRYFGNYLSCLLQPLIAQYFLPVAISRILHCHALVIYMYTNFRKLECN